jgi:hypothetical protein
VSAVPRLTVLPDDGALAGRHDDRMTGAAVKPITVVATAPDVAIDAAAHDSGLSPVSTRSRPPLQLATDTTPSRAERCSDDAALLAIERSPDAALVVSATGFAAGETVTFWLGGDRPHLPVGTAAADPDGNVEQARVPLPDALRPSTTSRPPGRCPAGMPRSASWCRVTRPK